MLCRTWALSLPARRWSRPKTIFFNTLLLLIFSNRVCQTTWRRRSYIYGATAAFMVVKVELDEDAVPSAVTVDRIDGMRCGETCTGNNHHTVTECTNLRVECFRFCGGVAFTGTGMPASRASDCSATGTAGGRGAGGPVSLELTPTLTLVACTSHPISK